MFDVRSVPFDHLRRVLLLFVFLSACAFPSSEAHAQEMKIVAKPPVKFAKGKTSIAIKGTAQAYKTYAYTLSAKKGQTMSVAVASPNDNVYLTVFAPGAPEPMTDSIEQDVMSWSGALPRAGTYKIMVFSKSDVGPSDYTLRVSIK